jgi:FkbM family methyltransferase
MYSQLGEDEIILKYFVDFKEKYGSFLSNNILDIGANDGITISNTRALILKYEEIKGYFVEPNPICFEKLRELYGESHNIYNFAISDGEGRMEMYCNGSHLSSSDNGLLSTLVLEETKRWGDEKWDLIEVDVKRYPFGEINFDFISIDTEGMDETILFQIDLSKTWMLCIEWNSNQERKNTIDNYCKKFSMDLLHENDINLIYTKTPNGF